MVFASVENCTTAAPPAPTSTVSELVTLVPRQTSCDTNDHLLGVLGGKLSTAWTRAFTCSTLTFHQILRSLVDIVKLFLTTLRYYGLCVLLGKLHALATLCLRVNNYDQSKQSSRALQSRCSVARLLWVSLLDGLFLSLKKCSWELLLHTGFLSCLQLFQCLRLASE